MNTKPGDQDLTRLIEQAKVEASRTQPQSQSQSQRWRWLSFGFLVLVSGTALHVIWNGLFPQPSNQTARDLEVAVDAARESIERANAQSGRLPTALPNAALASFVSYEPGIESYRLSAAVLGVRVTLEPDGRKNIETGVEK